MKLLIDIGHPAQVHQFKYVYNELVKSGHDVLFTAKDKEISNYLLRVYNKEIFKSLIDNQEIIKILKNKKTRLNFDINIYHFNKKEWGFEKKETFLDNLLKQTKTGRLSNQEKKDILYQKLVLYKRNKKTKKRIETYKATKRKKAY